MININSKSNRKNINSKNVNKLNNKKNINKLRNSYDDYYQKNNKYIKSNKNKYNSNTNKRIEILNYLKEINNLQNIISQLKKENSILKSSLEKEKQKSNKFRKLTEEIINHFEKANFIYVFSIIKILKFKLIFENLFMIFYLYIIKIQNCFIF